ncbi:hypothetical protein [Georgenia sp. SUBG003]|uniref:hypothetical protein n=1 Tax=Georgenia sp. SUBG003 TaxID=1497974 RepID=UPI003AB8288C
MNLTRSTSARAGLTVLAAGGMILAVTTPAQSAVAPPRAASTPGVVSHRARWPAPLGTASSRRRGAGRSPWGLHSLTRDVLNNL